MSEIRTFEIASKNVYSLDLTIHSWIYRDIQPTPEKTSTNMFNRIITVNDKRIPIHVEQIDLRRLNVSYPKEFEQIEPLIRDKVEWILGTDYDMTPVYDAIKNDDAISHISEKIVGAHPYTFDTFFEALIRAIIQQQISYRFANVVTYNLVIGLGPTVSLNGMQIHGFPNVNEIYSADEDLLKSFKLGYKVNYVKTVAKEILEGSLNISKINELSTESAIKYLVKFKGIGKWTAEIALMSGLRRFDTFPYGDLGIRRTIGKIYYNGKTATRSEVINASFKWHESPNIRNLVLYLLVSADVLGFL